MLCHLDFSEDAFRRWLAQQQIGSAKEFKRQKANWLRSTRDAATAQINNLRKLHGDVIALHLIPSDVGVTTFPPHDDTSVLLAHVTLRDGTECPAAIIMPASALSPEHYQSFPRISVGGAVASVRRSPFALPAAIIQKARSTGDYAGMGAFNSLLVSIRGQKRFLVPANSLFYKSEFGNGSDVGRDSGEEFPPVSANATDVISGDAMQQDIVVILRRILP